MNTITNNKQILSDKKLKWYETLFVMLPIVLAVSGGLVGAILGFLAVCANFKIFKSDQNSLTKYIFSLFAMFLASILYITIVTLLFHVFSHYFIKPH